jgi:hypothetical protein
MTSSTGTQGFRLFDPATLSEPYGYWAALRRDEPVHFSREGIGYAVITRYADVAAALANTEVFSSELSRRFKSGVSAYEDSPAVKEIMKEACPYSGTLNFTDGAIHTRHRRMVRRGFTVSRVRELDTVVNEIVGDLVSKLPYDREVDLWNELCVPLPIQVLGHILGVDPSRATAVKRWADAQVTRFGHPREAEAENVAIARSLVEMHQYLFSALHARRADPRDDFLSDMLAASDGVPAEQLVLICTQLLVAGSESTTSLLGSAIRRLIDDPAAMAALRADETLIPAAVEETLRIDAPIKLVYRFTTRDVEVARTIIPADTVVLLVLGSANQDDAAFDHAADFQVERTDARRHVAFGMGAHLCLGAELARTEARATLGALLRRTSAIEHPPRAELEHKPDFTVRALTGLPLILRSSGGLPGGADGGKEDA